MTDFKRLSGNTTSCWGNKKSDESVIVKTINGDSSAVGITTTSTNVLNVEHRSSTKWRMLCDCGYDIGDCDCG